MSSNKFETWRGLSRHSESTMAMFFFFFYNIPDKWQWPRIVSISFREELCTIKWFSSLPSPSLSWVAFNILNKSDLPVKYSCGSPGILWQYLIPFFLMMLIISIKLPIYLLIQHLMNSSRTAKISSLLFFLCDVQMWYLPQSDSDY